MTQPRLKTFASKRLGRTWRLFAYGMILPMASCAPMQSIPQSPPPQIGNGYPERLHIREPGPQEVVVVINDNAQMVHSGMFAADQLLDPAGSYIGTRAMESDWPGTSLQDYVRFQLQDGPVVKLYRFDLPREQFVEVKARIDAAGGTLPLFCAARVQNVISGIEPFESVPNAWLVSPATLAYHLDAIIGRSVFAGACYWPNGASCNPLSAGQGLELSNK